MSQPDRAQRQSGSEGAAPAHAFAGPVVLVLSPHAGHEGGADAVAHALEAAGVAVGERLLVNELDATRALGQQWRERGFRAAIAAGGDGTVGAVASQVGESGLPLGILPLGTSNDTARSLGIPLDLTAAARVIALGNAQPVDAGQALPALAATPHLTPQPPLLRGEGEARSAGGEVAAAEASILGFRAYFLHALTLGFNVQFARLATNIARRERLGGLNYAASLLEAIATFRPVKVTLRFAGLTEPADLGADAVVSGPALEVAAVNLPAFGGGMNLRVPAVKPRDQLLDFVVFETLEPHWLRVMIEDALAALARLPEAIRGAAGYKGSDVAPANDGDLGLALPGIRRFKARQAVIESEQLLAVTLDGEAPASAKTPVLVRVAPQPAHIFVPGPEGARAG